MDYFWQNEAVECRVNPMFVINKSCMYISKNNLVNNIL